MQQTIPMLSAMGKPCSLGDRLDQTAGVGPGFDALRVLLAVSIVAFHGFFVTRGNENLDRPVWLCAETLLPMFFALSGFLITASAQRLPLSAFLTNRALRIFPALFVEIALSAVVLGSIVTVFPLHVYFTNGKFWRYFANVTGFIQYELPGVFWGLPHSGMVNASLWTIPWELTCYALMTFFILTRLLHRPRLLLVLVAGIGLAPLASLILYDVGHTIRHGIETVGETKHFIYVYMVNDNPPLLKYIINKVGGWEFRVMPAFACGAAIYVFRRRIPFSPRFALLLTAGLVGISAFVPPQYDGPLTDTFMIPAVSYLTVFFGLCNVPKLPLFSRGDYSYGIYLYGYPIQQTVAWAHLDRLVWWVNALVSLPFIVAFAMFSWHFIERPILSRRTKIVALLTGVNIGSGSAAVAPPTGLLSSGSAASLSPNPSTISSTLDAHSSL